MRERERRGARGGRAGARGQRGGRRAAGGRAGGARAAGPGRTAAGLRRLQLGAAGLGDSASRLPPARLPSVSIVPALPPKEAAGLGPAREAGGWGRGPGKPSFRARAGIRPFLAAGAPDMATGAAGRVRGARAPSPAPWITRGSWRRPLASDRHYTTVRLPGSPTSLLPAPTRETSPLLSERSSWVAMTNFGFFLS